MVIGKFEEMKTALIFRKHENEVISEKALISYVNCEIENNYTQLVSDIQILKSTNSQLTARIDKLNQVIKGIKLQILKFHN